MKNQLTKTILAAAIALTVVACGPSGSGGLAGIGGSGYVSSGSVTGFGSVFVNGVEFETDSATFDVDGASGTQDDLAIGMIVRVSGSINDDGITGTATSISFDDEIQGPVSDVGAVDADGIKRSITVLGTTVILDSGSTNFDVSGDLAGTVFGFDTIAINNNVEVSGFFDSNGHIQATRVELKNVNFDVNSIVEVKGIITNLSNTTFNLGSLAVDASQAIIEDLPNGLVEGQLVEVKGNFDVGTNTINATKVEAEDNSVDDTDEFELEGLITDYVDDSNFKIGGISVDASNATPPPASLSLADDMRIEVEGFIVDEVLIATEIELEGGDVKIHAIVDTVNAAEGTFEIKPVSSQPVITITVTTGTQLETDLIENKFFTLGDIEKGDFVEVRGLDDDSGGVTATEVEVKELSDIVVQGYATAATASTITVLGTAFEYNINTEFNDENEDSIPSADVIALINSNPTTLPLVKIQIDKDGDEIADEIELE